MKHLSIVLTCLLFSVLAGAQAPQVTEVTANQFGSFVRIAYDLSGPADTPIAVSFAASNDGGQIFTLPLSEVYGDAGVGLSPGAGKVAIWDAGTDLPDSINGDVRIWVKTWIPNAAPVTLVDTDFVFVYADGHDTGGAAREAQLPGFFVTPCPVSTAEDAPAVPQALSDAYPDYAFEVFRETIAGDTWASIAARTPWADGPAAACALEPGWRLAAHYWPSDSGAGSTPDLQSRPWLLSEAASVGPAFALDTTLPLRDLDGDGTADDKTDRDQDHLLDAYQDYDGDGVADAFEEGVLPGVADAYGAVGTGEAALTGFADGNENQMPDFFESRYPVTSSTHPRGDRVYFNGSFAGTINDYQPGAAGYRWRIDSDPAAVAQASDNALAAAGPHAITAEPGDGTHYLHVAAVDIADAIIPGSARRFGFHASLQAPTISTETHPEPTLTYDRRVFAARTTVGYGPQQWRCETGESRANHDMLHFQSRLWIVQPDGGVWRSSDGFSWEAATFDAPWAGTTYVNAVVFAGRLWVHASAGPEEAMGEVWTTPDGETWTAAADVPWANRVDPTLFVFREALHVFGGIAYDEAGTAESTSPVWRTENGADWTQLTEDTAWTAQRAPSIVAFGDGLWMNYAAGTPVGNFTGNGAGWRSWDGIHWVPLEPAAAGAKANVYSLFPSSGDWRGWDNVLWRYFVYPWGTSFVPFHETLWYAGAVVKTATLADNSSSIWWWDEARKMTEAVPPYAKHSLIQSDMISYAGRLQLIGHPGAEALSSEFADRWELSELAEMSGFGTRLAQLSGDLFALSLMGVFSFDGKVERVNDDDVRVFAGFVAFQDQLWSLGGMDYNNVLSEVRRSTDGRYWTEVVDGAPWGPRYGHGAVVHDGLMWLLGGTDEPDPLNGTSLFNDVWQSTDGEIWTQVTAAAPWAPRQLCSAVSYDGALWVIGGTDAEGQPLGDAWRSSDGVNWVEVAEGVGPGPMIEGAAAAHQDSLFVASDEAPIRRYGRAYTPKDSLLGLRYVIDESPDTVPDDSVPLTPEDYFEAPPLRGGSYWLHVVAVDSLGQQSTVARREVKIQTTEAPRIRFTTSTVNGLPGNQFQFSVDSRDTGQTTALYYGLHTAPGGGVQAPVTTSRITIPCLAAGTYWLVAQSEDVYGLRSERTEEKIVVTEPVPVPTPAIDLAEPEHEEERAPRPPGTVVATLGSTLFAVPPIVHVVDQRYGIPTNFDEGIAGFSSTLTLPNMGIGRHYLHVRMEDNCGTPTPERTRSFFVRKRLAPAVDFGRSAPAGYVEIDWPAAPGSVAYRYVIDDQPDTVPTLASEVTLTPSLNLPVPEGPWQTYVHVCIEDTTGDLSDAGHFHVAGDGAYMVGLFGPVATAASVDYLVSFPNGGTAFVDTSLVSILPHSEGATIETGQVRGRTRIRVHRETDGPVAISLPYGSVSRSGLVRPAVGPSATGLQDSVPPPLLITASTPPETSGDPLVFTINAPDAEDLYLPARVLTLVSFPDNKIYRSPKVTYEAGTWTVSYTGVEEVSALRLEVADIDYETANSMPFRCTGYDRAGNCIRAAHSAWVDQEDSVPVVTITPPTTPYLNSGTSFYSLTISEPSSVPLDVSSITLVSDPPGSIVATLSLTENSPGRYTLGLSDITGDGELQVLLPEGFVEDSYGNASAEVLSEARTVDNTPPVITLGAPIPPAALGDPLVYRFTVSGAQLHSIPTVSLLRTGNAAGTLRVDSLGETGGVETFDIVITNYTGVGSLAVEVLGTSVKDAAGNAAATATSEPYDVALYRADITIEGDGTTNPPAGANYLPANEAFTFRATPSSGGHSVRWVVSDIIHLGSNLELPMDRNVSIHVYFGDEALYATDVNGNYKVELSELLRLIQFYNTDGLHCAAPDPGTEDGFVPGFDGDHTCAPHDSDYSPRDWVISLSELLRVIQFYNSDGYIPCGEGEDGFCPVSNP